MSKYGKGIAVIPEEGEACMFYEKENREAYIATNMKVKQLLRDGKLLNVYDVEEIVNGRRIFQIRIHLPEWKGAT